MLTRITTSTIYGVEALRVDVEAQVISALKRFSIVGLPDNVLKEAKDRVRCAIESTGYEFPRGEVVISLAPASLSKSGSGFDLALALAVLSADGRLKIDRLKNAVFLGELALDGKLKPISGAVAVACFALQENLKLILPSANAEEASLVKGVEIIPIDSLQQAVAYINGLTEIEPFSSSPPTKDLNTPRCKGYFSEIIGQYAAKRALEIVAAGGHNLLMSGPPGSGKSMLARGLSELLPDLENNETIEVLKIFSATKRNLGNFKLNKNKLNRPFRSPHHSTSVAGLIGGGTIPQPGEITLAHNGVLFLDELTEFRRDALESLRQPLETRRVSITRAKDRLVFPANFILVGAMNPCPCGQKDPKKQNCKCTPAEIRRYNAKLSGPIIERIDLHIWVPAVPIAELKSGPTNDQTTEIRTRIFNARKRQYKRYRRNGKTNALIGPREIKTYCQPNSAGEMLLTKAAERFQLSARTYGRILKVARTIADLSGSEQIGPEHISESLTYRPNS